MWYQDILEIIVEKSKQIFNSVLTGIYLHGSLAMGCFNPDKSDIDLILVIDRDMTDAQKLEFMKEVIELNKSAPDKGIELSIVKKEYCSKFIYPTPFELHFSPMHLQWFTDNPADYISKMKGRDKDLAAHFMIIKKYGIVLYGADINRVFSDIPREAYIDSIRYDMEGVREEVLKNPVSVILNLCRAAAFIKDNLVLSKKQGGEWGIENLPSEYLALISEAVKGYTSQKSVKLDKIKAQQFSDYICKQYLTGS